MIHKIRRRLIQSLAIIGICSVIYLIHGYQMLHKMPNEIVFIPKATGEEFVFWKTMCMGAELAAKEEGIQLKIVGSHNEHSIDQQKKALEEVVQSNPDILVVAPIDDTVEQLIKTAIDGGSVVVGVDSAVDAFEQVVSTDNIGGMCDLTKYMLSMLEPYQKVGLINFSDGSRTARLREEGYRLAIEETSHKNILPTRYTNGSIEEAYETATQILTTEKDIKALIGANQYMTEGIYMAVRDLGLVGEVKVMGYDSSDIIIEGIEKGVIEAILVQKPFNMGYLSVKSALEQFRGGNTTDNISVGYKLITKDVLYEAENQKLLYPIIE